MNRKICASIIFVVIAFSCPSCALLSQMAEIENAIEAVEEGTQEKCPRTSNCLTCHTQTLLINN